MAETGRNIRLIAVDLDHTLLDHELRIPDANRRALREAVERDIEVAIATGRTHKSAEQYARELQIDAPIISYNGAMVRRPGDEEPMRHVRLEPDVAAEIIETAVSDMATFLYFLDDQLYAARFDRWARRYLRRTGDRAVIVGDLRRMAGAEPTKILLVGSPEQTLERYERYRERFGDRAYTTISLPEYMELLNPGATKAAALRWLADYLDVPIEQTMALGDSLNDLEMVRAAGVGVFMPCADEELQREADFVPDRQREGVAEAIERLVLGRAVAREGGGD